MDHISETKQTLTLRIKSTSLEQYMVFTSLVLSSYNA